MSKQYHLRIDGLWRFNGQYLIHCPDIDETTLAIDGTKLTEWFNNNLIIGKYSKLVSSVPKGAERIPTLTKDGLSFFAGSPRTISYFINDLLANLPKDYPEFKLLDNRRGELKFFTHKPLSIEQEDLLITAIDKMRISVLLETVIAENLNEIPQSFYWSEMDIQHYKTIKWVNGNKTQKLWEDDEDFWNEMHSNLLNTSVKKSDYFQDNFSIKESSCIISDSINPPNIRNSLTLYRVVYLSLPIYDFYDQYWKSLGISEDELLRLVEMKRVKLLLPQPLHRYNPRLGFPKNL